VTVRRGERREEDAGGSLRGPRLSDAETIMGSAAQSHNPIQLSLRCLLLDWAAFTGANCEAGRAVMDGGVSLAEASRDSRA
jgi:hypothetical protein